MEPAVPPPERKDPIPRPLAALTRFHSPHSDGLNPLDTSGPQVARIWVFDSGPTGASSRSVKLLFGGGGATLQVCPEAALLMRCTRPPYRY